MVIAVPFLVVLLVAGLMLLITGVRGYRIGDHPVCRRCGFDLFGLPSGVSICSECGGDVSRPNSVRIGQRRRQPGSISLGVVFLLSVTIVASFVGWQTWQNNNWEEHVPTFWLIHETASENPQTRDPALAELLRRMRGGNLSDGEIEKLAARGLAFQADTTKAWVNAWGDVIDTAHSAGKLTAEQWRHYALNACNLQLIARPRVRQGDQCRWLPMQISDPHCRVGTSASLWINVVGEDGGTDLAWRPQTQLLDEATSASGGSAWVGSANQPLDQAAVAKASLGPKVARIKITEQIFDSFYSQGGPAIATKTVFLQAPWELVAGNAPTVQPINDGRYRATVVQSLKVRRCELSGSGSNRNAEIEITCSGSPVPLAYDVLIRTAAGDVPVSWFAIPASANCDYGTGGSCTNITAQHVDIVLKPSAMACAGTVDMTSFWNGEVIIPNVPLTHR